MTTPGLHKVRAKSLRKHVLLMLSSALLLAPSRAAAQSWTWTQESVDVYAKFTSLAVDQEGNIHIAYAADGGSALKYAFRAAASSQWFTMVLDKQLQDFSTYITLDPRGDPQICYTPRELKYARWDGKKWIIQQIAAGTGSIEYNCTLAVGADNTPHVIWYHTRSADGSNYLHLKHATLVDGVWMAKTVDFNGEDGKWNSIVLDASGNPHLTYSVFPLGELKYASLHGGEWKVQLAAVPTGRASAGMGNCLVLNSQNQPEMSFYESSIGFDSGSSGSLKFARPKGEGWAVETVDVVFQRGSWVGFRSSLVLDKHGFPHISYEDAGSLKHAYWDGTKWHKQVVAPRAEEPYLYSSMAIDKNDVLYISYRDPTDGSLKVAIGRNTAEDKGTVDTTAVQQDRQPN
ncbi:MAG TPA: hypothetical protein VNH65_13080 [Candidatus Acidoferrum sp.]|nr:hypothetical protein [Candidatus Acidoferrum sp.]